MHAEDLAKAFLQIDVEELHIRGYRYAVAGAGDPECAFGEAVERLRLSDCEIELAVMHGGGNRGPSQLRIGYFDAGGGEPQIEIEIVEPVKRDRQPVPPVFIPGK